VHNLKPVTIAQPRLGPAISRHDFAIHFYGNPIGFHAKLLKQLGKGDFALLKVPFFTIDG
jgi:hypothetical protein